MDRINETMKNSPLKPLENINSKYLSRKTDFEAPPDS